VNPRDDQTVFDDEGAGYLISVSDMMSGLLFIFIITLMAFVLNFQQASDELKAINQRYTDADQVREQMLQRIKDALEEQGIQVEISPNNDVLRLTENAIQFRPGQAILGASELEKLERIGRVLSEILPCYASGVPQAARGMTCDEGNRGRLESVFIEGHTDNKPISNARFIDNLQLSAARALFTYHQLVDDNDVLSAIVNQKAEPVFGVSGYGEGRPINPHDEPTDDKANRRIDLRFIMTPPSQDSQLKQELEEKGIK